MTDTISQEHNDIQATTQGETGLLCLTNFEFMARPNYPHHEFFSCFLTTSTAKERKRGEKQQKKENILV